MKYSKDEVMQYVIEEDVKFIRIAFCMVFQMNEHLWCRVYLCELTVLLEKLYYFDCIIIFQALDVWLYYDMIFHFSHQGVFSLQSHHVNGYVNV